MAKAAAGAATDVQQGSLILSRIMRSRDHGEREQLTRAAALLMPKPCEDTCGRDTALYKHVLGRYEDGHYSSRNFKSEGNSARRRALNSSSLLRCDPPISIPMPERLRRKKGVPHTEPRLDGRTPMVDRELLADRPCAAYREITPCFWQDSMETC